MSSGIENLEYEVANQSNLVRELMDKVRKMERQPSGLILPGPGGDQISRVEFVKALTQLRAEITETKELAMEAVRILDRMAGMHE